MKLLEPRNLSARMIGHVESLVYLNTISARLFITGLVARAYSDVLHQYRLVQSTY